jgi:hypothetical protein
VNVMPWRWMFTRAIRREPDPVIPLLRIRQAESVDAVYRKPERNVLKYVSTGSAENRFKWPDG